MIFLMYLQVAFIFGVSEGCPCDKLSKMLLVDIADQDNIIILHIPDSKTKKRRRFVIVDYENLALYRCYVALRPVYTPHRCLFVNHKQRKCTVQPVRQHSFGKFPYKIATYFVLPTPLE